MNVGDKVRIVYGNTSHREGSIGVITKIDPDDFEVPYLVSVNGVTRWYLRERVEPAPVNRPQVGDTVRVIDNPCDYHHIDDVGTITRDDGTSIPFYVSVDGCAAWYTVDSVEVVNPSPVPDSNLPTPEYGMSPDDLAGYVDTFIRAAKDRVTGIGAEQYAGNGKQKFEDMTISEIIQMGREEAQDLAVYAAMIDIRLSRISEALSTKGVSVVNL